MITMGVMKGGFRMPEVSKQDILLGNEKITDQIQQVSLIDYLRDKTIQRDIAGIKLDKSHIKVGDMVQNILRPEVYGIVVKVLYGENDPALLYIPHRGNGKSIFKDSLQRWEKVW